MHLHGRLGSDVLCKRFSSSPNPQPMNTRLIYSLLKASHDSGTQIKGHPPKKAPITRLTTSWLHTVYSASICQKRPSPIDHSLLNYGGLSGPEDPGTEARDNPHWSKMHPSSYKGYDVANRRLCLTARRVWDNVLTRPTSKSIVPFGASNVTLVSASYYTLWLITMGETPGLGQRLQKPPFRVSGYCTNAQIWQTTNTGRATHPNQDPGSANSFSWEETWYHDKGTRCLVGWLNPTQSGCSPPS